MLNSYENIQETLSYFGVENKKPYYVSSGNVLTDFPNQAYRMDYYMFAICTGGNIKIEVNGSSFSLKKNWFCVAAPSTILKFVSTSDDFRLTLLFFDKLFFLKNLSDPYTLDKLNLFNTSTYKVFEGNGRDCKNCLNLLDSLRSKSELNGLYNIEIITAIIQYIVLETAAVYGKNDKEPIRDTNGLYFDFMSLLKTHITEHSTVNYYAGKLCVSTKYLIQVIKKYSGKTPGKLIEESLVQHAYLMLSDPRNNISEISFALNFSSLAAFTRFFKNNVGYTPSQYRQLANIQDMNLNNKAGNF